MSPSLKHLSAEFIAKRHELMAFIQGLVRDTQASEDIFQEVWIRLAEAAEQGTDILDPPKWCRGVARNLILHHWRQKRGSKIVADSRIIDLAEKAFEERSVEDGPARQGALVDCVKNLPDKSKKALRLRYDEGLPGAQVALEMGASYDSVMRMLSRLRKSLAKCVQKRMALAGEQK